MYGLVHADAARASLLLNLEVVFTFLLAWIVFHDATSRRVILGFASIFAGSLLLSSPARVPEQTALMPFLAIAAACILWAIDNNLTRKISTGDARAIAAVKGLAAGVTNTTLALVNGATLPHPSLVLATLGLGFVGYGISLVLFVYALRLLGTARTGAYFGTAPFIGSVLALVLFGQSGGWLFWVAAGCMAAGVWLHLSEDHYHEHDHPALVHRHAHTHDDTTNIPTRPSGMVSRRKLTSMSTHL